MTPGEKDNDGDDEFFVGWQGRAPRKTGRAVARVSIGATVAALACAVVFAALQRTYGDSKWEYGNVREFSGVLLAEPVPTLLTDAPEPASGAAVFLLVRPFKFGFDPDEARALNLRRVRLQGTLLHRDGRAMIEVVPGTVAIEADAAATGRSPPAEDLGERVLVGEIVDSKCYLGAMNPGHLKTHRACAIRCISGGIPPVLLVRDEADRPVYYLLVGPDGAPVNSDVLDFVAEPVELRGRVQRLGERLVLRADTSAIRRLP